MHVTNLSLHWSNFYKLFCKLHVFDVLSCSHPCIRLCIVQPMHCQRAPSCSACTVHLLPIHCKGLSLALCKPFNAWPALCPLFDKGIPCKLDYRVLFSAFSCRSDCSAMCRQQTRQLCLGEMLQPKQVFSTQQALQRPRMSGRTSAWATTCSDARRVLVVRWALVSMLMSSGKLCTVLDMPTLHAHSVKQCKVLHALWWPHALCPLSPLPAPLPHASPGLILLCSSIDA